jgi:D-beta-D-heptose 7-phosphate kinase/D-beta-D-heptose 1-phosphate adenosyltransferase
VKLLSEWFTALAGSRVLVAGDLMLDEYLWGHIERISPEAPVPVLNLIRRESTLGGAGNVMRNLRSLGVQVIAAGTVGNDSIGEQILELLDVLGVESDAVIRDPHRKSTHKARLMSVEHGQQVFRLDEESTMGVWGDVEEKLADRIRERVADAQVILCSDYLKGTLSEKVLEAAFQASQRQRISAVVGPKGSNTAKYRGASMLMPNARELAEMTGTRVDGNDWLTDSASRLLEELDLEALVVTRGRDGMSLFEPTPAGILRMDVPTVARSVYDVTGAGDTAIATFCAALAAGLDRETAVQMANQAAGVVVGKRGTATVTVEEILAHFDEGSGGGPAPKTPPPRSKHFPPS